MKVEGVDVGECSVPSGLQVCRPRLRGPFVQSDRAMSGRPT